MKVNFLYLKIVVFCRLRDCIWQSSEEAQLNSGDLDDWMRLFENECKNTYKVNLRDFDENH